MGVCPRPDGFQLIMEVSVEWYYASVWMSCNDVWRQQRKWFQQMLMSKSSVESYQPLQRREVNRLLLDLLQKPAEFQYHMKRYVTTPFWHSR